ncbi:hypothetical protein [Chlamydia felis Fe/C-56]|uniref:Uncharacterized protein n=1 Tax=Chlamydia felis (strain Fe/C-56) TaxID=264202 RepID=Q254R4_CHLFF|nr:DUF648 domain-containing protein [Chlamydia felis]BAE81224.1 hypothetical protein [Chlamydia felis Fe/C-56]
MLNSVTFTPTYSPSRVEKLSAVLDSYFYLQGKKTKVIDKSTELGLRFAVQHQGHSVPTTEKVLKVLSWIFIPIVIVAWILRQALHLYLHIAYPCVYLDTPLPEALQKDVFTTCQKISRTLNSSTILTMPEEKYQELKAEGISIEKPKGEFSTALPVRFYLDSRKSHTFYLLGQRDQFDTHCLDLYHLIQKGKNLISEFELTGKNDKKSIEKLLRTRLGIAAKITNLPNQNQQALYRGLKAEFYFDNYPSYVCSLEDNTISLHDVAGSYQDEFKEVDVARFVRNVLEARHLEKKESHSYISWPKYIGCDMSSGVVILDDEEENKQLITTTPQGNTEANLKFFSSQAFIDCYKNMKKGHMVPYVLGEHAAFKHHQNKYQLIMNESGSRLPMDSCESRQHVMTAFLRQVPSAFLGDVLKEATPQEVASALRSLDREKIARSLNLNRITIPKEHILQKKQHLRLLNDKQIKLQLAIEFIAEIVPSILPRTEGIFIPYREQSCVSSETPLTLWGILAGSTKDSFTNSILLQLVEMHILEGFTEVKCGLHVRLNTRQIDL